VLASEHLSPLLEDLPSSVHFGGRPLAGTAA